MALADSFAEDTRPIGIFDSGIGGVSVLNCFAEKFPNENYIYVGDTARLPYGNKSPDTIRKYCLQILNFLIAQNVKMIVVACNTASTQIHETMYQGVPVIEMISSGMMMLDSIITEKNHHVLLLATRSTVRSQIYQDRILATHSHAQISAVACPLFVPFVEEGLVDHSMTETIIQFYLDPVANQKVSSVILGCTHYPFLKPALQKYFSLKHQNHVFNFIDCGQGAAETFALNARVGRNSSQKGSIKIYLTDFSEYFSFILRQLSRFSIDSVEAIHL